MPWKGVTVSEQRQRFIEDYLAELLLDHRACRTVRDLPKNRP